MAEVWDLFPFWLTRIEVVTTSCCNCMIISVSQFHTKAGRIQNTDPGHKTHVEHIHTYEEVSIFPDCFSGVKYNTSKTRNGQLICWDTVWERALSMNLSMLLHLVLHISPSFVRMDNNSFFWMGWGWGAAGLMGDGIWLPSQPLP